MTSKAALDKLYKEANEYMEHTTLDYDVFNTTGIRKAKMYDNYKSIIEKDLEILKKYKSIEQELGCPLDIIFKAIKQGKIWWHEQWCKIFIVAVYEDSTRPYIEVICKDYNYHRLAFIDEYKKSWWLKKDRSE